MISKSGNSIEFNETKLIKVDGVWKSQFEVRQMECQEIIDEVVYIARASEGALTPDWLMKQPIFVRKKYFKQMQEEQKKLANAHKSKK